MPIAGADEPLSFGHFELRPAQRALRVRGESVAIGSRAFDVLLVLAERHERLVTKQELLDLVWPGLVVEEHNIATQIGNLRKVLGASAIATLPGYGYRLTVQRQAGPAATLAPGAVQPARHNLPDQRTRFIGREVALADLARLISSARLLTLTGIGGCGKTRLALQFAQQQCAEFAEGGVWFVDLAPLKDAARVTSTCAALLGLHDKADAPLMDRLLACVATRRMLLVLDNCEHVMDGVVALADALLAGAPGVTILATSREALGLVGEQIYRVPSLSLPATGDLPEVLGAESARVFVDRARLVSADFELDAGNAAAIGEICRRLDGIALAIELAAARVTMLSVADIAERLDDRFRLLTTGNRALPRHQTLQAALQWSYELLAPQEQHMLRQVAVFAGGWTLQAAADIAQAADEYEALTLLTRLHDKSLLVVEHDAASSRPRYRMLETVRQYALDRLDDRGEGEAARGRHLAHYLALAEAAEPHFRGPEQDAWMSLFRREHENLVAALTWCCEGPVDAEAGLRLATATNYYWVWNGVELGHGLTRAVLERGGAHPDASVRAGTQLALAKLSLYLGRYADSLACSQEALVALRRLGAPRSIALALDEVGTALNAMGRVEEALRHHDEAVEQARPLGDARLMSRLLNNLAEARRSAGDLDGAESSYREALELARAHIGRMGTVTLLNNLLRVQVARGLPDPARCFAIECLHLVRDEKIGVDLLEACAGLASCLGEHGRAARLWGAANQKLREWGYRFQPVDSTHTAPLVANSRRALGDAAYETAEAAGRKLDFAAALRELEQWLEPGG